MPAAEGDQFSGNLEMSGNFAVVMKMSGNLPFVRELSGECRGKNLVGETIVFNEQTRLQT